MSSTASTQFSSSAKEKIIRCKRIPELISKLPKDLTANLRSDVLDYHSNQFQSFARDKLASAKRLDQGFIKEMGHQIEAAVLLPLCHVRYRNGYRVPSVLFTVRSVHLRKHSGEVSLPGGLLDEEHDSDLRQTVIRETTEEIRSIKPDQIHIFGTLQPVPDKTQTIKVTPFVGYVGELERVEEDPNSEVETYVGLSWNPDEVSHVFTVPMWKLLSSDYIDEQSFRLQHRPDGPFWRGHVAFWRGPIRQPHNVPTDEQSLQKFHRHNTISLNGKDHYRIWGLSAFVLSEFLTTVILPWLELHDQSKAKL